MKRNDIIFRKTYILWIVVVFLSIVMVDIYYSYLNQWGNNPITYPVMIGLDIFFLLPILLLNRASIFVDRTRIVIKIGRITFRKIQIERIHRVEQIDDKRKFSFKKEKLSDCEYFYIPTFDKTAILLRMKHYRKGIMIGLKNKDNAVLLNILEQLINNHLKQSENENKNSF